MNILDFKGFEIKTLSEIIEKQKEVMIAFEPNLQQRIEEFDIDIFEDQMLLKDFLLVRSGEEITEAAVALDQNHFEHYKEELVDTFNFLIEASYLVNWNEYSQVDEEKSRLREYFTTTEPAIVLSDEDVTKDQKDLINCALFALYKEIGLFTNKLKLRPWRQSQYPVDLLSAKKCWKDIWSRFWVLLIISGISWIEFCSIWSRKYQVNKFRIESNY